MALRPRQIAGEREKVKDDFSELDKLDSCPNCGAEFTAMTPHKDGHCIQNLKARLASARDEGLEAAAKKCEEVSNDHLELAQDWKNVGMAENDLAVQSEMRTFATLRAIASIIRAEKSKTGEGR